MTRHARDGSTTARRLRQRLGVAAVLLASLGIATPAMADSGLVALPGSAAPFAGKARVVARAPSQQLVAFTVYLRMRSPRGAAALAVAVSNPQSPSYRHFLTNAGFIHRFAPTRAQVASVERFLRAHKLTVTGVAVNRMYITGRGTIAAIRAAFGTVLLEYAVPGGVRRGAARPLLVPGDLRPLISDIGGISESVRMRPAAPPSLGYAIPSQFCSAYWGQLLATSAPTAYGSVVPQAPCGYTPTQLQSAYGTAALIASGVDGRGQVVAFVDTYDSATLRRDASTYSTQFGLPAATYRDLSPHGLTRAPNNPMCGDWYGEQTLDAEAIHAMAPRAGIVYMGATDCFDGLLLALHKVIDTGAAQIVTNSWGNAGEGVDAGSLDAYSELFVEAALKGIGVYFASGDNGDGLRDPSVRSRQPNFPANSPLVTAVGGTSLGVGSNGEYLFETGWGTTWASASADNTTWVWHGYKYGGGGGTSRVFAEPPWQKSIVPSALAGYFGSSGVPGGGRVVPDVSMDADPATGMLLGQTQAFFSGVRYGTYRSGGTSLASPLFAGVMALADQAAGARHGFANPALYAIYASGAFNDPTAPTTPLGVVRVDYQNGQSAPYITTLRTLDATGSLHTTAGFDDVTGLGSPHGAPFINQLAQPRP